MSQHDEEDFEQEETLGTADLQQVMKQLKRMSDQLNYLERKIDQILAGGGGQGGGRPQFRRDFGNRPPRKEFGGRDRERGHGGQGGGFRGGDRPFYEGRKEGSGGGPRHWKREGRGGRRHSE